MFIKKTLCTLREWLILLVHILIPITILLCVLLLSSIRQGDANLPERIYSLDTYKNPVTIVNGTGVYKQGYIDILMDKDRLYEDIGSDSITDYIIKKIIENNNTTPQKYILATSFAEGSINALFNNDPYHSPPLALSMAVDSIVRAKLSSSHNIRLTNYPFPFRLKTKVSIHKFDSSSFKLQ